MLRRVELPAVSAKRFVRTSAWDTPWDRFVAAVVVVTFFGTSRAFLSIPALECFVANLLAFVALFRSWSVFEYAGRAGLSPSVEEAFD